MPLFVHPEWEREFPWLVQGITGREFGNFASFGSQTAEVIQRQWRELRRRVGVKACVLGRQVHGNVVLQHGDLSPGIMFTDDADGHLTKVSGVLLAVSIADCVPVTIVDPQQRAVAALHAGWRGTAAHIVAQAIRSMGTQVRVHLGPAICGNCYEVGPEVHEALGLETPVANTPVDLRSVLRQQCLDLGVADDAISISAWCSKCGDSPFYSHRAGHPERQVTVVGVR